MVKGLSVWSGLPCKSSLWRDNWSPVRTTSISSEGDAPRPNYPLHHLLEITLMQHHYHTDDQAYSVWNFGLGIEEGSSPSDTAGENVWDTAKRIACLRPTQRNGWGIVATVVAQSSFPSLGSLVFEKFNCLLKITRWKSGWARFQYRSALSPKTVGCLPAVPCLHLLEERENMFPILWIFLKWMNFCLSKVNCGANLLFFFL